MGVGKSKPKEEAALTLEEILYKNHGLFDIKIREAIKNSEGLCLVYIRGVENPCLEIKKGISRNYELNNKANNILVLIGISKFYIQGEKKCYLTKKNIRGIGIIMPQCFIKNNLLLIINILQMLMPIQ